MIRFLFLKLLVCSSIAFTGVLGTVDVTQADDAVAILKRISAGVIEYEYRFAQNEYEPTAET